MTDAASAAPVPKTYLSPSQELAIYRENFPAKAMMKKEDNADQLKQMQAGNGMYDLPPSPAPSANFPQIAKVPTTRAEAPTNRHLWVIRSNDMPVALEFCEWGKELESKCIKHTNLTGGQNAHSGGELWFVGDGDHIALNAGSGRYGAQSEAEFGNIVEALRRAGYHVASAGFDIDNSTEANRTFAGDPDWQGPL